jgi:acetyl esterase/lipase
MNRSTGREPPVQRRAEGVQPGGRRDRRQPKAPRAASDVYHAVTPYRVIDTRTTGAIGRGTTLIIDTLLGDVAAAAVQITVAETAGPGFLTAWSDPDERPETSVLNFRHPNDVDGNFVIVPVSDGKFKIYTSETTAIIVDVMGYATAYSATTPRRVLDTRITGGTPAGSSITVPTGLAAGTPAAAVQITVADTAGPGFLTAWSGQGTRPETSVLNYRRAGDVDGNFVIVPLAGDATFEVYTLAHTGIIVDLMGVPHDYTAAKPQRVLDTRQIGGTAAGSVVRVETNLNPAVTAVAVQITVADAAEHGFLTVWDGAGGLPDVSALNYLSTRNTDSNFMIVPVRDGAFSIFTLADAGIIADVMGYTGTAANVSYDVADPNPSTLLPDDVAIGAPDTYRYGSHPLQALDVYRGTTGQTLVWLHGGGWEGGDKALGSNDDMSSFNRVPRLLHADGWTVVSVNYRLSPGAHLEDLVDDFYASVLAVAQNAAAWHVDLDRLVVGGFSGGAHISGLGATALNDGAFDPPDGLPAIRAILSQDGNLMSSLFAAALPEGSVDADGNDLSPAPAIARLLDCPGWSFGQCPAERIAQSDIATYSDSSDPPLYLIGGTHSLIPFDVQTQTRDLVRAAGQVAVFDGVDTGPEWLRMHDVQGMNWAALRAFLEAVTTISEAP